MMTMMKADRKLVLQDVSILSAFDPVVEGSTFQILEEGLDPQEFARLGALSEEVVELEVLKTFDLGEALARVPEKLFFRIGEVAELLDVKAYVLRFWETEFPTVSPQKSRSGQRVYRKKDVETLLLIKHLLYVERFSIEGARKRIRELKSKPAAPKASPILADDRKSLRSLLAEIKELSRAETTKFFRF
jgi:DNA-binding transcriptional MerR regulator